MRSGKGVHSPLVPKGRGDFLLAMERLEGTGGAELMKPESVVIMAGESIFPDRALLEKDEYPKDAEAILSAMEFRVKVLNAGLLAGELGKARLANTILPGALSMHLPFPDATGAQTLQDHVPPETVSLTLQAFARRRDAVRQQSTAANRS